MHCEQQYDINQLYIFSAPTTDQSPTQEYPDQPEEPKTPSKRRHSQDLDDSKRVKTDPVEVKQEPVEVKQEPGVTPGPCNDQAVRYK